MRYMALLLALPLLACGSDDTRAPAPDATPMDAALDATTPDGSAPDGSGPDATPADASPRDASPPDASPPDASRPDASRPDASPPDAGPLPAICADLIFLYDSFVARPEFMACMVPADCHVVRGHCSLGLGGCHHAVVVSVTQEVLDGIAARWMSEGCARMTGVCDCPPAPEGATCTERVCSFAP